MALNCYNCANNLGNRCRHFGFVIGMHTCPHAEPIPPKTNACRIRSMTDKELANFFMDLLLHCTSDLCHNCPLYDACFDVGVSKWLEQEVSE